jgi:uncharacterized protein YutE (UPF0331/DUF86 family)
MVLRIESLHARLAKLDEIVQLLLELGAGDRSALKESLRDRMAVERGLQLGAELVFDIGNHILSAQFGAHATDYEDIVRRLAQRKVISDSLRARLEGLGGFRNVLVHGYMALDPDLVLDNLLKAPKDFRDFMTEIRDWLEEQGLSLSPPESSR